MQVKVLVESARNNCVRPYTHHHSSHTEESDYLNPFRSLGRETLCK